MSGSFSISVPSVKLEFVEVVLSNVLMLVGDVELCVCFISVVFAFGFCTEKKRNNVVSLSLRTRLQDDLLIIVSACIQPDSKMFLLRLRLSTADDGDDDEPSDNTLPLLILESAIISCVRIADKYFVPLDVELSDASA